MQTCFDVICTLHIFFVCTDISYIFISYDVNGILS